MHSLPSLFADSDTMSCNFLKELLIIYEILYKTKAVHNYSEIPKVIYANTTSFQKFYWVQILANLAWPWPALHNCLDAFPGAHENG